MAGFSDQQLQDIQGLGIAGFKKPHSEFIFLRFGDAGAGRAFLGAMAPLVSSAFEVGGFNRIFSEARQRTGQDPAVEATWVGLAVSSAGYGQLGIDLGAELPQTEGSSAFVVGMAQRGDKIGDTRATDRSEGWLPAFRPPARVDALVLVAGDDAEDLAEVVLRVENLAAEAGCAIVYQEPGAMLDDGKEHFGFRDGGSQPAIDGYDDPPVGAEPAAAPAGEFVLGYPDQSGNTVAVGDLWTNGSFLVYRRLRQHVGDFRNLTAGGVPGANPPVAGDSLGAKLIGRWPSGAPLELNPNADPGPGNETNAFGYAADPEGLNVPRFAHIRKANPRDGVAAPEDPRLHRMIRRGTPYGPALAAGAADDGVDRGLHFVCVVADPDRQFEFVQRQWLNDPNFPSGAFTSPGTPYGPPPQNTPADGVDPVVGEHDPNSPDSLHQTGGVSELPIPSELVTVTAGEYFFLPSIGALAKLGAGATASNQGAAPASGN